MLSFSKIVTLSAMALGTLTQAVPLLQRNAGANEPDPSTGVVIGRADDTPTLEVVFDGLVETLDKVLEPLLDLTDATEPILSLESVVDDVVTILDDATKIVKGMAVRPIDDVLKGANGVVLAVPDVLRLVSSVVSVVFKALDKVISVVNNVTELLDILPIVVKAVINLLQAVCDITRVVFKNQLVGALLDLLNQTEITIVLSTLKIAAIVLH